jgi:hypothetical protein
LFSQFIDNSGERFHCRRFSGQIFVVICRHVAITSEHHLIEVIPMACLTCTECKIDLIWMDEWQDGIRCEYLGCNACGRYYTHPQSAAAFETYPFDGELLHAGRKR